jgi:hypothetical protein
MVPSQARGVPLSSVQLEWACAVGAYTRPLLSSTCAVSNTKYTLNTPQYPLTLHKHPLNKHEHQVHPQEALTLSRKVDE